MKTTLKTPQNVFTLRTTAKTNQVMLERFNALEEIDEPDPELLATGITTTLIHATNRLQYKTQEK